MQREHIGCQPWNHKLRTTSAQLPAKEAQADGGQHGEQVADRLQQAAEQALLAQFRLQPLQAMVRALISLVGGGAAVQQP